MFVGSFKYSVDAKNRVAIPAKLRRNLKPEANETFVMTRGMEKCINIFPLDIWNENYALKFREMNPMDPEHDMFIRLFLRQAAEEKLDIQSRLMIPKNLIEFAEIKGEVLIVGQITKIELWNPDIYDALMQENQENFKSIAKEIMKS